MKSAKILKEKINSGKLTLGLLVTNHLWLELIEIARNAGLDYLIIDQEHHDFDGEKVAEACALGRLIDFPILLRPLESQTVWVRRAVDLGAMGFLLPMVESAAMLDGVRDALYMPPRGKRRPGGAGNRWVTDFNYPTWRKMVEDDFIVLPQIESVAGLENADTIARHEITTAMAVGPYDLSANLGVCFDPAHPKLLAAQDRVRDAGRRAGKNTWMIGHVPTLMQRGFTFLCAGEATGFLEARLTSFVSELRAGEAKAAPGKVNDGNKKTNRKRR